MNNIIGRLPVNGRGSEGAEIVGEWGILRPPKSIADVEYDVSIRYSKFVEAKKPGGHLDNLVSAVTALLVSKLSVAIVKDKEVVNLFSAYAPEEFSLWVERL